MDATAEWIPDGGDFPFDIAILENKPEAISDIQGDAPELQVCLISQLGMFVE